MLRVYKQQYRVEIQRPRYSIFWAHGYLEFLKLQAHDYSKECQRDKSISRAQHLTLYRGQMIERFWVRFWQSDLDKRSIDIREFDENLDLQLTLRTNYLTRGQILVVRRATSEARDASRDKSRVMLRVYKQQYRVEVQRSRYSIF